MRTNLESPRIYEPKVSGLRLNNVVITLTGTLVIPSDAPTVWILNGGAADRTIRLPNLTQDKQVVIANVGTTNVLNVTDSSGTAVTTIPANTTAIFFGGTSRWVWITTSFLNSIVTTVVTGSGNVLATDVEVQVNSAGATVLTLPLSTTWAASSGWTGLPLSIIDISGNASVNNITVNTSGGQTISGQASSTISNNWGVLQLRPKNGGGWLRISV